ncbi:MAG TPA: hypothetical protein VK997_06310 [Deferrisomatales bacterium]|nr:hypothetical protein [Deferrisomatales bacterium]
MSDLNRLFDPQAIAIYGVSLTNPFHPTDVICHRSRLPYRAAAHGIAPRGGDLPGEAICTGVEEIPDPVGVNDPRDVGGGRG